MAAAESYCIPAGEKRRRVQSSSEVANPNPSDPITKLGDDLLVEILIRLPNPKSACRCKLVSKPWASLLSAPYFNTRFASAAGYSITSHDRPASIFSFLPPLPADVRRRFRVLDCFKDLLLCGFSDGIHGAFGSYTYVICNPFTKQWLALPLSPRKSLGRILMARLVICDDEEDQQPRGGRSFRVVCVYAQKRRLEVPKTLMDVFCSESGEWTEQACVLKRNAGPYLNQVVSRNGKLFWLCGITFNYRQTSPLLVVGFDPFRLDSPPSTSTSLDHPPQVLGLPATNFCSVSVSQGALHVLRLYEEFKYSGPARRALEVWSQDGQTQRSQYALETSKCDKELEEYPECSAIVLHPGDPKSVYLEFRKRWERSPSRVLISCDLRTGELKLFNRARKHVPGWTVFQPQNIDWLPTPIPRYEELRSKHNGFFASLV